MGTFLRTGIFSVVSVIILLSQFTYAQESYFDELSPKARREEAAYLAAVDVFSTEEMRGVYPGMWEHGLSPSAYWTPEMEKAFQKDPADPKLKTRAAKLFVKMLRDLSIGTVDPESLTSDIKFKRKNFISAKQLQTLIVASGRRMDLLVGNLAPQTAPYLALKTALKKVYPVCANKQWWIPMQPQRVLKLGVADASVPSLKQHLAFLGYKISSQDPVVDKETIDAINDIEWNMRIKPDSELHPGGPVWKFLSTPCTARVRQLQADMEKMRWFPRQFEERYIFINLALSYFVMVDKTQNPAYVTSFRTINGRPQRKSPTMRDEIVRVILNPFWIVPPTIFIEDKVKEIRELSRGQIRYYFESKNYEVWNREFTKRIDPESINWWAFQEKDDANIFIRQRPNFWNALGVIKFDLTNSFSVYLHDTNQRELFWEPDRILSSGCIRLEKPMDLAVYLLRGTEWDQAKIESVISKPGEVKADDTPIRVPNPIPVYTVFMTSFMGSDNILRFTEDSYGQNARILQNLKAL